MSGRPQTLAATGLNALWLRVATNMCICILHFKSCSDHASLAASCRHVVQGLVSQCFGTA